MSPKTVAFLIAAVAAVPMAVSAVDVTVDASLGNSPYDISTSATYGSLLVGNSSTGEVRQTAGTTTLTADLQIGVAANTDGTYRLDGGALLLDHATARIGYAGTGTMVQTGGLLTNSLGTVLIGASVGSTGNYSISGGTASFGTVGVGSAGTGAFTINGGAVISAVNLATAAGSSGTLNLNGGVLLTTGITKGSGTSTINYNGGTVRFTTAGRSVDATTSRVQAGGAIFDVSNAGQTASAGWLVHDPALGATPDGGLTKRGAGTLKLSGSNTYTGTTTLAAGTLSIESGTSLGTGPINFAGGTLAFTGNFDTNVSSRFLTTGNQPISIDVRTATGYYETPVYFSGGITGEGTSLTKLGLGTLNLGGTNTYTGTTYVSAGKLTVGTPAALPGYGVPGRITVGGTGTLEVDGSHWSAEQITAVASTTAYAVGGQFAIDVYGDTLSQNVANLTGTLGGSTRFLKTGNGTLLLAGSNTFTGGVTVLEGTVVAATPASLPGYDVRGKINGSYDTTLAVRVGGPDEWTSDAIRVLRANTTYGRLGFDTTNAATGFTYGDVLGGTNGVDKFGPNTLTLTASNTYTGMTQVREGTLSIPTGGRISGNVLIRGGTLAISGNGVVNPNSSSNNFAVDGAAAAAATVTVADNGVLTVSDVIRIGSAPDLVYDLPLNGRGRVVQTGGTVIAPNGLWIAMTEYGGGSYEMSGGSLSVNYLSIASGSSSTGSFTQSGGVTTVSSTVAVGAGSASSYSSFFANNASLLLTGGTLNIGTGSLTIGSYTNSTGIVTLAGGRLRVAQIARNSSGGGTGTLVLNGGTISPTTNSTNFIIGLSAIKVQTGGAIFDTAGFNISVAGLQHDTALGTTRDGGLRKTGSGTLTLSTGSSYTGTTTIEAGTLATVTNSYPSLVSVTAGGIDITGVRAKFTLQHTANDPFPAQIRALLAAGFASNFATGKIRSSTATAVRGLGYADTGTTLKTLTVMATLYGDADLDGGVSINDFNALATNFGQTTGKVWVNGDFDYDGGVSINDFNLLAAGFGQSVPASGDAWAGLLAFAAAHDDLTAFEAVTGVPEPAALTVFAGAAVCGLRRRQRGRA